MIDDDGRQTKNMQWACLQQCTCSLYYLVTVAFCHSLKRKVTFPRIVSMPNWWKMSKSRVKGQGSNFIYLLFNFLVLYFLMLRCYPVSLDQSTKAVKDNESDITQILHTCRSFCFIPVSYFKIGHNDAFCSWVHEC